MPRSVTKGPFVEERLLARVAQAQKSGDKRVISEVIQRELVAAFRACVLPPNLRLFQGAHTATGALIAGCGS